VLTRILLAIAGVMLSLPTVEAWISISGGINGALQWGGAGHVEPMTLDDHFCSHGKTLIPGFES